MTINNKTIVIGPFTVLLCSFWCGKASYLGAARGASTRHVVKTTSRKPDFSRIPYATSFAARELAKIQNRSSKCFFRQPYFLRIPYATSFAFLTRILKCLETRNFAHFHIRLLPGNKRIRKTNKVMISLLYGKYVTCRQQKSHQTFVLAAWILHRQTGRVEAPMCSLRSLQAASTSSLTAWIIQMSACNNSEVSGLTWRSAAIVLARLSWEAALVRRKRMDMARAIRLAHPCFVFPKNPK